MPNHIDTYNKNDVIYNLAILDDFLTYNKQQNEHGMNITMAQGLLCAITSSPCVTAPSDWMFVLFGGIPNFQSTQQSTEIYTLLFKMCSAIVNNLLTHPSNEWKLWNQSGEMIAFQDASDKDIVDFCSGYIKGYLLDPLLHDILNKEHDDSSKDINFFLAFLVSLIK